MSLLDMFSDKQKNETASGQTGTQSYGLTPQVLDFWRQYSQQFSPGSWSNVGDNPHQTQAAGSMAGYAGGLTPAFSSASSIAAGGINPASIAAFQSPHTQQVVDAYQRNWEDQRGKTLAQNQAAAVKAGVPLMHSSQSAVNRALTEGNLEDTRSSTVANLYNQGFQQASDMAAKSAQTQLGGAQAASGIAGQQAGIMNNLFGQGTQLWNQAWQNGLQPYQLSQMGLQGLSSLVPLSGNNTSGSSWGNQTSTATPSPFSIGMNLASLPFMAGWKPFGAASGGAITRDMAPPGGGATGRPHDRLSEAFDVIHGLITRSKGGAVLRPFADGGAAMPGPWETTATPTPTLDWGRLGKGMAAMGAYRQQTQGQGGGTALLDHAQQGLSQMLAGMSQPPRRMAAGGVPEWNESGPQWGSDGSSAADPMMAGAAAAGPSGRDIRVWGDNEPLPIEQPGMGYVQPSASRGVVAPVSMGDVSRGTAPAPAAAPSQRSGSNWFRGGIWSNNEEATPWQKLGLAMASVSGPRFAGPMNGFAKALTEQHDAAMKRAQERRRMEMQAEQFAKRLALERAGLVGKMEDGTPTAAASQAAQRIALEKAGLTGRVDGVPTVASRQADSAIASANLERKIHQFKLDEMEHPENAVDRRKAVAPKIGLKEGTPEYVSFLATGQIPAKLLGSIDKDKISSEAELRKEVNTYAKDYTTIRDAAATINSMAGSNTPFSHMALVFSYMKLLDPGSVVREGEYANAANATSVPERIRNLYNKAIDGTILAPSQVQDLINQAKTAAQTKRQFYETRLNKYKNVADRLNLDWRNIILVEPDEKGGAAGAPASGGAPVAVKTPDEARRLPPGTKIILPDGTQGVVPGRVQ